MRIAKRPCTIGLLLLVNLFAAAGWAAATTCRDGWILFESERGGNMDLYLVRPDGSDLRQLTTDPAADASPSVSPDGTRIAFTSDRDGNSELYLMNSDGTETTRLTHTAANEYYASWSPDGALIVCTQEGVGDAELCIVDVATGEVHAITDNDVDDWAPSWSPDGRAIAFVRGSYQDRKLCLIAPDGDGLVELTGGGTYCGGPQWSPDGSQIAYYQEVSSGNTEIFLLNADGSDARQLTFHPQPDMFPVWSPDGECIAFASLRSSGYADVYVLNVASPRDTVRSVSPAAGGWDCPGAWLDDDCASTADHASAVIATENVHSLVESIRFDVAFNAFTVSCLAEDRILAWDSSRAVIWDLATEELLTEFSQAEIGRVIGICPGRELLAIYAPSRRLEIWTVDPLEEWIDLCSIEDTEWPRAAFSADGRLLAVVNRWNDVEIWDLEEQARLHNCVGHHSNLFALAFSPDGRWLASGGGTSSRDDAGESFLGVWDVATGDRRAWLSTEDLGDNHDLTFTLDGSRLISAGNFRMLAWDTQTWERAYDSGPSYPGSYGISLSPDGTLLAIAADNRTLRIVETGGLRTIRDLYVGVELMDVAFSPDGTKLAASSTDGIVRVWKVR